MNEFKFCTHCGAQIPQDTQICPVCGEQQFDADNHNASFKQQYNTNQQNFQQKTTETSLKDKNTAMILCVVSIITGIHGLARFYTGHVGLGIIQLITIGGCGIWTIIDLVQIAIGNFNDAEGKPLKI